MDPNKKQEKSEGAEEQPLKPSYLLKWFCPRYARQLEESSRQGEKATVTPKAYSPAPK